MPTLFDVSTGPPSRVTAGEQDSWTETFADYPNSTYRVEYVYAGQTAVDGWQTYTVTGAESETAKRTFTLDDDMKPGVYQSQRRIVRKSDSVSKVAQRGCLVVAPDLATTPTTTYAASQVTAIKAALTTLSGSTNTSVSFNGQSFTRGDVGKLQQQLAYWESRVIAEQRKLAALSALTADYACDCDC